MNYIEELHVHKPLIEAIQQKQISVVQELLGKNEYAVVFGLLFACDSGNLFFTKLFIEQYGAQFSHTHMKSAVKKGHYDIVEYLASRDARFEEKDVLPAVQIGLLNLVKFIILRLPVPFFDFNCFLEACNLGHFEIVQYLFKVLYNKHVFLPFFHGLAAACKQGHLPIVQFLTTELMINIAERLEALEKKMDVVSSAIMRAVAVSDNLQIAEFFIQRNVVVQVNDVISALTIGNYHIAKYFLQHAVDVNAENFRAMCHASSRENYDMMFFLCEHGADISVLTPQQQKIVCFRKRMLFKKRVDAVNTIGTWWIPICYDLKRECGKRIQEKIWKRIESYVM